MKNKLILFGAGDFGKEAFKEMSKDYDIKCFVDNNKSLQGTNILGVQVISPTQLKDYIGEDTQILVTTAYYREVGRQLQDIGINDYTVYIYSTLFNKPDKSGKVTRCTRCVMDNESDEAIFSVGKGECNYCVTAFKSIGKVYFPNKVGEDKLNKLIKKVKAAGEGKDYDCIMGLSGGLDSSYLTYLGHKWGLRVLVVHVDDGFDTEISKSNIRKLIEKTGFDYDALVPDEKQYKNLVKAYMKAGVPNVAIPQDNLALGEIYRKMKEKGIEYFLSGGNFATECILQKGNTYDNLDVRNIKKINEKFGEDSINQLCFISREEVEACREDLGIESLRPLDLIDYNKDRAFRELREFCGFEYYGRKHLENTLTQFIQLYWFPKKFNVDKRKSHLSSLIVSGQMSREEAVKELEQPLYKDNEMMQCIKEIKYKLNISDIEFDEYMNGEPHLHEEYN